MACAKRLKDLVKEFPQDLVLSTCPALILTSGALQGNLGPESCTAARIGCDPSSEGQAGAGGPLGRDEAAVIVTTITALGPPQTKDGC